MPTVYPCVPGHEIVGRVAKVGSAVKKFKEGDLAAVGCMVDSCRTCPNCQAGWNNTATACRPDLQRRTSISGGVTYGGYSDSIVVDEAFVLRVPTNLDLAGDGAVAVRGHHDVFAAAPLEGGQRAESRHRRPGRAGAHGREVRPRFWRARGAVHDFAEQEATTRCGWARTKW